MHELRRCFGIFAFDFDAAHYSCSQTGQIGPGFGEEMRFLISVTALAGPNPDSLTVDKRFDPVIFDVALINPAAENSACAFL